MAHKLGQLRVVPKPQREHVPSATEDDGFPPPVVEGFLSEDEMPRRECRPALGAFHLKLRVPVLFPRVLILQAPSR
jgi:hypothetical protein